MYRAVEKTFSCRCVALFLWR